jgi:chaperonin GroES
MKFRPLDDRVVVKPDEPIGKSAGGILIPDQAKERPARGRVLLVGPGAMKDGQRVPPQVKVGDLVLYGKYSGSDTELDGVEVIIMREIDILGIIG